MHINITFIYSLAAFKQKSLIKCDICEKVLCTTSSFSLLRNILNLINWIGSICENQWRHSDLLRSRREAVLFWNFPGEEKLSQTAVQVTKTLQQPLALLITAETKLCSRETASWRACLCLPLTHHVHQRHIQEEPGCEGEYPHADVVCVVSDQDPGHHAQVGHHGRQHVIQNGLTHRHTGLQEHRKVTWETEQRSDDHNMKQNISSWLHISFLTLINAQYVTSATRGQ